MIRPDYAAGATIYGKFSTQKADGTPVALSGTPALSVYKANSTAESTSGVTLTVDFDSRTGLNHYTVDTSQDGTFYAAGNDFSLVITTGTVDSVSVVGRVVGEFSLDKQTATANVTKIAGTTQTARDLGASVLLSSGTGTGQVSLSSGAVLLQPTQTGVTIPTVTNLTNAPTAGDLTATMKASVTAAVPSAATNAAAAQGLVLSPQFVSLSALTLNPTYTTAQNGSSYPAATVTIGTGTGTTPDDIVATWTNSGGLVVDGGWAGGAVDCLMVQLDNSGGGAATVALRLTLACTTPSGYVIVRFPVTTGGTSTGWLRVGVDSLPYRHTATGGWARAYQPTWEALQADADALMLEGAYNSGQRLEGLLEDSGGDRFKVHALSATPVDYPTSVTLDGSGRPTQVVMHSDPTTKLVYTYTGTNTVPDGVSKVAV